MTSDIRTEIARALRASREIRIHTTDGEIVFARPLGLDDGALTYHERGQPDRPWTRRTTDLGAIERVAIVGAAR